MKVCFATNNPKKLTEIRACLGVGWEVVSLADIGCREELPETGNTLEHNARQKAAYVAENYRISCFADDTGLEVEVLNGAPGVDSAHYAGPQRSDKDNIDKLLTELSGATNRRARFRTVLCWQPQGSEARMFQGEVSGTILNQRQGEGGFGYDPVFQPEGHDRSFAQMSLEEKNSMSHRARAMRKLADYLSADNL